MATKIQSLTVPARDKAEHDCQCGCASCEGTCCSLDCIVKPRFFCGQLLTDADLSAMLKWARDRFGLTRYRHGWGVVCGLDVRCDPQAPTSVIVTPGYAVNCCGDDVIVCETAALDLKGACRPEADPCADLRRERDSLKGGNKIGVNAGDALGKKRGVNLIAGPGTGGEISEEEMRVVDIYLSYTEQPTEPSTALGRSSCKQTPECEYSRTRESYKLSWEIGVKGSDPMGTRARTWHEGYEKCLEVLTTFRQKFNQSSPAGDVRRSLLRWIDEHPQYQLCGLREGLCQADDDFFTTEKNLVEALFALVQNCRNAYLQCECFGCDEDTRVPLARVWLTPDNGTTGQDCRIIAIDPYPPYRRPIQPECWPAPLGYVNVGQFIWHRWEEVCPKSADLGLRLKKGDFKLPATLAELERSLKCDLFIKCNDVRTALVFESGLLGPRVVGFCDDAGPAPPECPTIQIKAKSESPASQPVPFAVRVDGPFTGLSWTVSPGTIQSGQGTDTIVVDAAGQQGKTIVATVHVQGLDPRCPSTAEARTLITGEPPPPDCPSISVKAQDEAADGTRIQFEVVHDREVRGVFYNWTISPGRIVSGQEAATVTVDTSGLAGKTVTAIIDVGGLDASCPRTAEGRTRILDQLCPTITVTCPIEVKEGDSITYTGRLVGGPQNISPTFNWSVSAGTITSGQGTEIITVDSTGLGGQAVTATLEVGGVDPSCTRTASCTTNVLPGKAVARKFDEFPDTHRAGLEDSSGFEDENARLDNFAIQLKIENSAQGFIFGHLRSDNDFERVKRIKEYLVTSKGIDEGRLVVAQSVKFAQELKFELWIVPPGAEPPQLNSVVAGGLETRDDLTQLDQIATMRRQTLEEAGIRTFADLAKAEPARLKELFPTLGDDVIAKWIEESKKRAG